MIGIFKYNDIETIGGTTPQTENTTLGGAIIGWQVVDVPDNKISSLQEFNIQPVSDDFIKAINGPKVEGAYNAPAYQINGIGDKMRIELNPGQIDVNGNPITLPADRDTVSQKNFSAEDIKPYQEAYAFIKKYDNKTILRNNIRGTVKDIEDDIADTKIALQAAMYYISYEWKNRTEAQRSVNPNRENMNKFTDMLLSDETKMRSDLANGLDKIHKIIETEEKINNIVETTYKYNDSRGI